MNLPDFRFHLNPIASGSVVVSEKKCRCCGQARGAIYVGPVYAEQELDESLCPWCIADGSAHEKFDATFVDTEAFQESAPAERVDEITQRTPGFATLQQERWPSCCEEPGAFVTPAGIAEIRPHYRTMEGDLMGYIVHEMGISGGAARRMLDSLNREKSPTAFVFQCRKCERHFGYVDSV
jgi:uncharacterized protein CbrC (UPF0167 family)